MATTSLVEAGERGVESREIATRGGRSPIGLAVGSAVLLWASFPPADWGWLAWVALAPLFLLVESHRNPKLLALASWAGGFVFWALAVQWVRLTDASAWLAWLAMALALSVFWPAFFLTTRLVRRKLDVPLILAAPIVWVALEYVRAYAVTGFPWYYLAHSQHNVLPVIQVSDITGSLGVSLLIAVVNAWLVDLVALPLFRTTPKGARLTHRQTVRLVCVSGLLLTTLGYGAYRLSRAEFRDGPRVALLQSCLPQRLKGEKNSHQRIMAVYEALVARAVSGKERPDLIVWPETSYPYPFATFDPEISVAELDRQSRHFSDTFTGDFWKSEAAKYEGTLRNWTQQLGVPMLVGVSHYDHRPAGMSKFNSSILVDPSRPDIQAYSKLHLVPFGEYVPLIATFPWLLRLTPYSGDHIPSLNFGPGPRWLDLGPYRVASAICFEDTVPQVFRQFFVDTPGGREPDLVLNQSNDGWFGGSSEHEMHLAVSVFRAVEHRVPLARAANTGVSAIVDGNGRVVRSLPTLQEGVVVGVVPLDPRTSLYTRWGDWLGQSCLSVTVGFLIMSAVWKRTGRPASVN